MTVGELISALKEYQHDLAVVVGGEDGDLFEVAAIWLDKDPPPWFTMDDELSKQPCVRL